MVEFYIFVMTYLSFEINKDFDTFYRQKIRHEEI